jgi:hypothetical protein
MTIAPITTANGFILSFDLSVNGGSCGFFPSTLVPITAGKGTFGFSGASLGLTAVAGDTVTLCGDANFGGTGFPAGVTLTDGNRNVLIPGIHLGSF